LINEHSGMVHEQHKGLTLGQWFPKYVPQHTAVPPDVIWCATKMLKLKSIKSSLVKGKDQPIFPLGRRKD